MSYDDSDEVKTRIYEQHQLIGAESKADEPVFYFAKGKIYDTWYNEKAFSTAEDMKRWISDNWSSKKDPGCPGLQEYAEVVVYKLKAGDYPHLICTVAGEGKPVYTMYESW